MPQIRNEEINEIWQDQEMTKKNLITNSYQLPITKEVLVDIMKGTDRHGNSALHLAAIVDDIKIGQLLMMIPSLDPKSVNKLGCMPYQLSVVYNHYDISPHLTPDDLREGQKELMNRSSKREQSTFFRINGNKNVIDSVEFIKDDWDQQSSVDSKLMNQNHMSQADQLMIEVLGKDGMHDQLDIVRKYECFKQSMLSFKKTRDNLHRTLENEEMDEDSQEKIKQLSIVIQDKSSVIQKSNIANLSIEEYETPPLTGLPSNKNYFGGRNGMNHMTSVKVK